MSDDDKKPEEPVQAKPEEKKSKWGLNLGSLAGNLKNVADAAKISSGVLLQVQLSPQRRRLNLQPIWQNR